MSKNNFVTSSGNVFADMGLNDTDGLLVRAQLGHTVRKLPEEKGCEGREGISKLLGADPVEISKADGRKISLALRRALSGFSQPVGLR